MSEPARSWLAEFVLLAAIWGSSFLFTHIAVVEFGALPTAGLRVAIASAFLLPLLIHQGQGGLLARHWKSLLVVGVLNSALPFACFAFALLSISTGLSGILNATVPLFGALVAWLWLHDRPDLSRSLGLMVGFAGVATLAWNKASFTPNAAGVSPAWGVLACLLATLCYGIAASFTKRHMAGVPPLVLATGSQLAAALVLAPFAYAFWPAPATSHHAWAAVTTLGILCTGVAYILFFRIIERAGPARALSVTFGVPVFAVLYGVTLLGETVTPWMVGCGIVIVAGTLLSTGLVRLPSRLGQPR